MWLNNKLNSRLLQLVGQLIKDMIFEAGTEVCNRYFITIYWVVEVLSTVVLTNPMAHKLIPIEVVILPFL